MQDPVLACLIVDCLADALIDADPEGRIRGWNAAAEALFGFAAEAALGQSLDLIIPEDLRAAHWRGYRMAMHSGEARGGRQVRLTRALHRDGHAIYVEMSFAVLRNDRGEVCGSVAVARDAAPHRATQRELRQLRERLDGTA